MTVIAYRLDNNQHTLAADRCASAGDTEQSSTKIWMVNGAIIATNGNVAAGQIMKKWFMDGEDLSNWPESQSNEKEWGGLVVCKPGEQPYWYEQLPVRLPVEGKYRAWGCGRDNALGALYVGASAAEAVEAANYHISGCGFGVDSYSVQA